MEELRKKTEAMLRAVLISSPRGVALRRLDREYKSITFSSIPFKEMGCASLEAYIKSIPKVATLKRDVDGEMVVKGVASESDQHVAKLIAKQRKPKKRSKPAALPRRPKFVSRPYGNRPVAFSRPVVVTRPIVVAPRPLITTVVKPSFPSAPRSGPANRFIPPRMMRQAINQTTVQSISRTLAQRGFPGQVQQNPLSTTSSRKVEVVSQPVINKAVVDRGVARQVEQQAQEMASASSRKVTMAPRQGKKYVVQIRLGLGRRVLLWGIQIGHFRVAFCLCFKVRSSAKPLIWKQVLFGSEWKLIFIWKVSCLALLWKRCYRQLKCHFAPPPGMEGEGPCGMGLLVKRVSRQLSKGPFKLFRLLPIFSFDQFVEQILGLIDQLCDFVESAEISLQLVKWKPNQVWIWSNVCLKKKKFQSYRGATLKLSLKNFTIWLRYATTVRCKLYKLKNNFLLSG